MRIATWNVNGLRARLDYITRWLEDRQPDVVGLQELKTPDELFPTTTLKNLAMKPWCTVKKAGMASPF